MKRLISFPSTLHKRGVLGINRRNLQYIAEFNRRADYPKADDKLITKALAKAAGIAVPDLYHQFRFTGQLKDLKKHTEELGSFVVKPSRGSGGEGVLVIDGCTDGQYLRGESEKLSLMDLRYHCAAVLHGLYSLGGQPDSAMVEEKVVFDPLFEGLTVSGVPDVRLIVYQGIPLLAMARLPTNASNGRANLHQGAVGVGVKVSSGVTTFGVLGSTTVEEHPDTGKSLCGLQLPRWDELLDIATRCYDFSRLGYLGVDLVYDKAKGPLLLEINARPGLAIQLANMCGLRERVAIVESIRKGRDLPVSERLAISATLD